MLGMLVFYLSIVCVFFYAFYQLNLWQIRSEAKQAQFDERQARIEKVKKRREERRRLRDKAESEMKELI